MRIHRMTFGFRFNKKAFRINSLQGVLLDELFSMKEAKTENYLFNKVDRIQDSSGDSVIILANTKGTRQLHISLTDFLYKRTATGDNDSVNFDTVKGELKNLLEIFDSIIKTPYIRRIGIVSEYRTLSSNSDNSKRLLENITHFPASDTTAQFKLEFAKRISINEKSKKIDVEKDEFEQVLYTIYNSEQDETPGNGTINANIDYQKYFSPSKARAYVELMQLQERLKEEKAMFVAFLNGRGIE